MSFPLASLIDDKPGHRDGTDEVKTAFQNDIILAIMRLKSAGPGDGKTINP